MRRPANALLWIAILSTACATQDQDPARNAEAIDRSSHPTARDGEGEAPDCAPGMEFALCLCDDFDEVGQLRVLQTHPDHAANVGVNGFVSVVDESHVEGSWHAYQGFHAVTVADVRDDILTDGSFDWVGDQVVGRDLAVGGDVTGVGSLTVAGELRNGGAIQVVGPKAFGSTAAYVAPSAPPCGCEESSMLDIAKLVADAATNNDNAGVGLSDDGIINVGSLDQTLPSGRYYVASLEAVGEVHFRIEGAVELYVDDRLVVVGRELFELSPGATLSLFVAGGVDTVGNLVSGSADAPDAFRLFVGGPEGAILTVGEQTFYGSIYAPTATFGYVGETEIVGSLFAHHLDGVGRLTVRFGEPICEDPDPDDPDPTPPESPGVPK